MADHVTRQIVTELVNNGDHIRSEVRHFVCRYASRLAARVIAALVGSDHAKARARERAYLLAPAIPELRKAVQQDHHRAVLRTRSHRVQSNVTMGEPLFFKSRFTPHPLKLVELSYLRRRWGSKASVRAYVGMQEEVESPAVAGSDCCRIERK